MKASFSLLERTVNLDQIEGKYSAFVKVPYALAVRLSKPLAENGHGTITVDGKQISRGTYFYMDVMVKMHCMLVPVGEVATEYGKEYQIHFSGFTAADGTPFKDQTLKFKTLPRGQKDPAYAEHDEIALQAAREGIVLLKNENHVLPLAKDAVLNCFGSAQYCFRNTSTGASLIKPRWQANFHQSIEEHSAFRINEEISELYRRLKDVTPTAEQLEAAKAKSDTAIILISRTSGEFKDNKPCKGGYYLTDDERAMAKAVSEAFSKTVAILNTGYPIEMGWLEEMGIDAAIYTGFAGQAAGYGLMEILDGRTNPSGKLPDTFAYDYYDYPSAHNFINFKEEDKLPEQRDFGVLLYHEEDIYVGYRYFDTFGKKPAYSFGHGLSYTAFDVTYSEPIWNDSRVCVHATVKNVGTKAGKEVVQLYIAAPDGKLEKPAKVLAAFEKTHLLNPGDSEVLTLTANALDFASYDDDASAYILEAGEYGVFCGNALDTTGCIGSFSVGETRILRRTGIVNPPVEDFHRISRGDRNFVCESRLVPMEERIPVQAARSPYAPEALPVYTGKKITFPELKADHSLLTQFVAQMTDAELCRLNVCGGANWYMPWQDGSAGNTVAMKRYALPAIKVSDGNTGLNLNKPNIGFPSSTVMAATFNKELVMTVGRVIGEESKERGIAVNLGPGMNIHRNPLNGRHPEYFSEDPYLTGIMAAHHGKGLLAAGTECTYKHMFCNGSDTSRQGSHSIVSHRALREIYYKAFEIAISNQMPSCVMTSYNIVNGLYPAENAQVLQELIRGEWKFEGVIMTDWNTYEAVDAVEMVKAGNCWLTEGSGKYVKLLRAALKEHRLERSVLENNVRYIVKMVLKKA